MTSTKQPSEGATDLLASAQAAVRTRFDAARRVLSFSEYLEAVQAEPRRYCRDAARYLLDAIRHYGEDSVERPWGNITRYRIFDLPFAESEGRKNERLVGHEEVQAELVRALHDFEREGQVNRLLLLHGPNGSAKSTMAACLIAGLEHFSTLAEGVAYRFSWIFPRGDGSTGGIGFSTVKSAAPGETFAHLPEERIDAKLPSEQREHPLLLLPLEERRTLLERMGIDSPPDLLWNGDLSHKNRQIFDALLTAYRGDLSRVLAHVQVERVFISRRYRTGAVTIGPQMAVDARERQITADRSLASLPASLSATTLFESYGELVDGAGGIIEFSDLLKRPLDAWKYLLTAIETGEIALPLTNMQLNSVLIASSNEMHLKAFQDHPEYHSFRGRLRPVRVPYLRNYAQEQGIYDAQIVPQLRVHVAPHATYVAALWAVLTRLRRARKERHDDSALGALGASLTPIEKADLYTLGRVPRRFDADEAKLLAREAGALYGEQAAAMDYEGLFGASPREMRGILHGAAGNDALTPEGVFAELDRFSRRDDYVFLKLEPDGDYHDARAAIGVVRRRWLERVDDELRSASGLIDESQYLGLFDQYVNHVSHAMKGERLRNPLTGDMEEPDAALMERVESILGVDKGEAFRGEIMGQVAAWALDHPGEEMDYGTVFEAHIDALEEAYFVERRDRIRSVAADVLRLASDDDSPIEDRATAEPAYKRLLELGYEDRSVREALSALMNAHYA
ncbi:MAG: serine protein kinase PrkA [Myxococcota bacterium]